MRIEDRHIGLATLILLAGAIAWVSGMMVHKNQQAMRSVTVFFDEMGSLQPEDPVTSRGYPIGKVGTVVWRDGKAVVELLLDEPMILRSKTLIRNENFSLMGQRRIEIVPTKEGSIVGSDYVFRGQFEAGIAEAMHLVAEVRNQVIAVRDLVFLLTQGDSTHPSVSQHTEAILHQSETMLQEVERIANALQPWVHGTLHQVNQMTSDINTATLTTDTLVQKVSLAGKEGISDAHKLLGSLQQQMHSVDQALTDLQAQPVTQALLNDRKLMDDLQAMTQGMRAALELFDSTGNLAITDLQGNPRPLLTLSNINLVGATARQKALEKQQEKP